MKRYVITHSFFVQRCPPYEKITLVWFPAFTVHDGFRMKVVTRR